MLIEFVELLAKYPALLLIFCLLVLIILIFLFYIGRALIYAIRGFLSSSNTGTLKVGNLLEWKAASKKSKRDEDTDVPEDKEEEEILSQLLLNRIETCIRQSIQETASYYNRGNVDSEDTFDEQVRNAEKILDDVRRSINSRYSADVYSEIKDRNLATASVNYFEKVSTFHFSEVMSGLTNAFRANHLGKRNDEAFQEYTARTANQLTGTFMYNLCAHEKPIYTHVIQNLKPEFERLLSTAIRGILSSARESSVEHSGKVTNWRALMGMSLNSCFKRSIPSLQTIDIDSISELREQ